MLRRRERVNSARLFAAANDHAERLLAIQKQYAAWAGLSATDREAFSRWCYAEHARRYYAGRERQAVCWLAVAFEG